MLNAAAPDAQASPAVLEAGGAPGPLRRGRKLFLWMLAFFAAVIILLGSTFRGEKAKVVADQSYPPTTSDACRMARKFIEDQLKAPTVTFEGCEETAATSADGAWTMLVTVDARNGNGKMLQSRFLVSALRYMGDDEHGNHDWRVRSVLDLGQ